MSAVIFINTYILGPALPIVLTSVGVFFAFKYRFFHMFHPIKIMKVFAEKSKNGVSPFKAVTLALAGTLGVGNIVGVAAAITAGGAGAVFWMWLSSIAAMLIKYSEIVLAVKFRKQKDNHFFGGAVYYIRDGLGKNNIAVLFAVLCIVTSFSMGNAVQIKAAADACYTVFGVQPWIVGSIAAILAFSVIWGGVKTISNFTVKLIPILSIVYIILSMYIIIINFDMMSGIFTMILNDAFSPESALGGISGYIFMRSLRFGTSRGIMSNEAGCGTAPTAHAASNTDSPVKQGCWGLFEVFFDTIVLCTMTALVILISYDHVENYDGMLMVLKAFELYYGKFAGYILCGSVCCFAFATIVCWAYYGIENLCFISSNRYIKKIYIIAYSIAVVFGSSAAMEFIWEFSDLTVGIMTVVNTICVCALNGNVAELTKNYFSSGKPNERLISAAISSGSS